MLRICPELGAAYEARCWVVGLEFSIRKMPWQVKMLLIAS